MQLAGGGSAAEAATTAAEEEKKDNSSFSGFTFDKQTQSLMDSVSQRTCKENIIQLAVDLDTCTYTAAYVIFCIFMHVLLLIQFINVFSPLNKILLSDIIISIKLFYKYT